MTSALVALLLLSIVELILTALIGLGLFVFLDQIDNERQRAQQASADINRLVDDTKSAMVRLHAGWPT